MIAAVPLTVVLQGRPELRERLTELLADKRARVISLGALSGEQASALVDNLASALGTRWDEDLRESILERARGSPLFIEELAAMANEEGVAGVPLSLRALIAARLDLLPPEAKRIAQAAAVVGDVFWDGAVAALLDGEPPARALRRLRTRGFIEEEAASAFLGQRQFRFRHALIREATYESIPKVEGAELHRRAAAWLRQHAGDRPELIVPIAAHLEQALSLLRRVAPLEPVPDGLVEAAVEALRDAAAWTAANASVRQSIALLRRAVAVADGNPQLRQLSSAQLAAMLARSGALGEAVELAEAVLAGPQSPVGTALASLALAEAARSRFDVEGMREAGGRALEIARSMGLPLVEVDALDLIGLADAWSGRLLSAVGHRRRATEIALELGDVPRAAWNMAGYSVISLVNMGKIAEAERQAAEAMRLATQCGSLRALESAHVVLCFLRRAQDRLEEALEHAHARVDYAEKLGERLWLFNALVVSLARALIDLGLREEAWACIERALTIPRETVAEAGTDAARAMRVGILLAWRQLDEAAAEASLIDSVSEPFPEVAELRAAQGRDDEAEEIWLRALDQLAGSDDRLQRTETVLGYARFLAARGRSDEARARLAEARDLVEGTGAKFHERLIGEVEELIT